MRDSGGGGGEIASYRECMQIYLCVCHREKISKKLIIGMKKNTNVYLLINNNQSRSIVIFLQCVRTYV